MVLRPSRSRWSNDPWRRSEAVRGSRPAHRRACAACRVGAQLRVEHPRFSSHRFGRPRRALSQRSKGIEILAYAWPSAAAGARHAARHALLPRQPARGGDRGARRRPRRRVRRGARRSGELACRRAAVAAPAPTPRAGRRAARRRPTTRWRRCTTPSRSLAAVCEPELKPTRRCRPPAARRTAGRARDRRFRPHVTVARMRPGDAPRERGLPRHARAVVLPALGDALPLVAHAHGGRVRGARNTRPRVRCRLASTPRPVPRAP